MKVLGLLLIFFVLRANSVSRNIRTRDSIRGRSGNAGTDGSGNSNADNVLCSVKTIIDSSTVQIQSKCKELSASNDRETKGAKAKCNTSIRNLNSLSRNLPQSCPDSSQTMDSSNQKTKTASTPYPTTTLAVETTTGDSPTPAETTTPFLDLTTPTTPEETTTKYYPTTSTIQTTTPYITTPEMEETTTEEPATTTPEPTTESSETPTIAETTTQYTTTPMMEETTTESIQCNEILTKRCDNHCLNNKRINLGGSCTIGERNTVRCKCIKVQNCEVYQNSTCQSMCRRKSSRDYCKIPEKNIPCACSFQSKSGNNVYYELP